MSAAEDDPDFLLAVEPIIGMRARIVAHLVLHAQLTLGGEVVPVAEAASLDDQIARAVGNVRRQTALVVGRHPGWELARRAQAAAEASETFCVAVSLSVAHIGSQPEWAGLRERRRSG